MAGRGGGQQEGGSNSEWTGFIFLVVIAIALGSLWYFARPVVLFPAFALDYVSITVIELIKGLGTNGQAAKNFVSSIFDGRTNPWDGVTFTEFYAVRDLVGHQTRWVIVAMIIGLTFLILTKMKGEGFSRKFSLGGGKGKPIGLNHFQSERWRVATASAHFDPDGRDKGILPARTPPEWMQQNNVEFEDSMLDRDAAEAALIKQLGKPWNGVKRATLIQQTIAILCALHYQRSKASLSERETINIAWAAGSNGTAAMKELTAKYLADEKLVELIDGICGKHAYAHTALYALLDAARAEAGVLASSDFLWLRWTDRDLHYTLNNVGRRRFHVEGAAAVCHFFAERVVGGPLPDPELETAIDGIEDYMHEQGLYSLKETLK